MTLFRQLYDSHTATNYIIDNKSLVFKAISDEVNKETRLKPHFSAILSALFAEHPQPVSYKAITNILKNSNIVCPDETRLHRKVSELRAFLSKFHPGLNNLICNIRGIGYSLPLYFKDPEIKDLSNNNKISNKKLQNIISCFETYIEDAISLSKKCSIIKFHEGFILQRKPVNQEIEHLLNQYDEQKKKLYIELRFHPADFIQIRLEFILAKLKTYLGLARISEFSITKEQWLEWYEHEAKQTLNEIIHLIKRAEQL